ncbi:MAG: DUF374 domain-containing protein [Alphaproteobacteria bacterium]|nr:DUF374 domain-containing protein [Alphaproteobacteria bacterium]
MSWLKRLGRHEGLRGAAADTAARYVDWVWSSGRWTVEGEERVRPFWNAGQPILLAFWHARIAMAVKCWPRDRRMAMLISAHRDGQFVARIVARSGIEYVPGSATRGGSEAIRRMIRAVRDGASIGITPDGPRGPRMRAQVGVAQLARLSGAPIVPMSWSAAPRRLLSTWDRFVLPAPFCRGLMLWGEPIHVPRDADAAAIEAARRSVEERLNDLTLEADRRMGGPLVEPAPESMTEAAA